MRGGFVAKDVVRYPGRRSSVLVDMGRPWLSRLAS